MMKELKQALSLNRIRRPLGEKINSKKIVKVVTLKTVIKINKTFRRMLSQLLNVMRLKVRAVSQY